jgi:MFS family permease
MKHFQNRMLVVLGILLAFNYVDRLALGLMLQNIKSDLGLSDSSLGFLNGLAFAIFYSIMGVPLARWADRGNRVLIIAVTTALWSCAVVLCGYATNYPQLLLARIAVAIGEAGCIPCALSLIAEHFTRAERPRAIAKYFSGKSLSVVVGYFLAGWLITLYGWRATFALLGLPGIGLAVLAWFTLREPRSADIRTGAEVRASSELTQMDSQSRDSVSVLEAVRTLWSNRTFRSLLFCYTVASFFDFGILQWKPTFFMRSFGLDTAELGLWFAVTYGASSVVGLFWGAELAARRAALNERAQLVAMCLAYGGLAILSCVIYLSSNPIVAFIVMGIATLGINMIVAPLFAVLQSLVPPRVRATSTALMYLCANLVGMGLGPWAVGGLSDLLTARLGDESLRYALLIMCPGYLWVASYMWRASRTVMSDLAAVDSIGSG